MCVGAFAGAMGGVLRIDATDMLAYVADADGWTVAPFGVRKVRAP